MQEIVTRRGHIDSEGEVMAKILDFILHAMETFGKCSSRGQALSGLFLKSIFLSTAGRMDYSGDKGRILETAYDCVMLNRNSGQMLELRSTFIGQT